jgi:hypothetical protein
MGGHVERSESGHFQSQKRRAGEAGMSGFDEVSTEVEWGTREAEAEAGWGGMGWGAARGSGGIGVSGSGWEGADPLKVMGGFQSGLFRGMRSWWRGHRSSVASSEAGEWGSGKKCGVAGGGRRAMWVRGGD